MCKITRKNENKYNKAITDDKLKQPLKVYATIK